VGPLSRAIEQWRPDSQISSVFASHDASSVAVRMILALGEIGGTAASKSVQQALEQEEPNLKTAAAIALGKLGDRRLIDRLLLMLWNSSLRVRLSAAAGLEGLGEKRGRQILEQEIKSDEENVRREALAAWVALYGDDVDVELVTRFVPGYGHQVDPLEAVGLWSVEVLAEHLDLPRVEVRERFERLSGKIPLTLAWRTSPSGDE
jgi:hypothetical protein